MHFLEQNLCLLNNKEEWKNITGDILEEPDLQVSRSHQHSGCILSRLDKFRRIKILGLRWLLFLGLRLISACTKTT